jgi:hypothetical protein
MNSPGSTTPVLRDKSNIFSSMTGHVMAAPLIMTCHEPTSMRGIDPRKKNSTSFISLANLQELLNEFDVWKFAEENGNQKCFITITSA